MGSSEGPSQFKKNRVSFEEAVTVFLDPNARRIYDPDHSQDEDRWIFLGLSRMHNLLVVVFVERDRETIRIVSGRKANKKETIQYAEYLS